MFVLRCCFIFPLDTPISVLRCAKYKFISKSEASRKAMSEEAWRDLRTIIFSTASDQISSPGGVPSLFSPSPAVKTRALRKSPAFRRIVCWDSLIQFSCSLPPPPLFGNIVSFRLSFLRSLFLFLSLFLYLSTIRDCPSGCNLGQSQRINLLCCLPTYILSPSFTYPVSRSTKIAMSKLTGGPGGP